MVKVECPSCSAPYDLDEQRLPATGLRMRCPKCGASFHVNRDGSVSEAKASVRPPKVTAPGAGGPPGVPPPPPRRPPSKRHKPTKVGMGDTSKKPGVAGSATARILAEMEAESAAADLPAAPTPDVDLPAVAKPKIDLPAVKVPGVPKPNVDLPAVKVPGVPKPNIDLPALKAKPNVDLPAVKRKPLAPSFPAPPMPAPPMPPPTPALDDGLDLPMPKRAKVPAPPAFDSLDLPTPKKKGALDELDLPAPKAKAKSAFDDLDLPAPKSAGGIDELDLPAALDELDLPMAKAKKGSTPFDDMMGDLPAPVAAVDLPVAKPVDDLPMPKPGGAGAFADLDLPMPKAGDDFNLDLPSPKKGGDPFDLDLPMPSSGADLPAPVGSVDLPMPSTGLDLPMPSTGLDLPMPSTGLDLPMPSTGVDLPAPSNGLDLPAPSNGLDLPAPSTGLDLPAPSSGLDLPAPRDMDVLLTDHGGGFDLDDLSLPSPRDDESSEGRSGAGSANFGELDLGGDSESLEFDDIPEEDSDFGADLDAVGGMDLPPDVADAKSKKKKKKVDATAKPRRLGLWLTLTMLLVVVLGGVGLKWTQYGIFGMHYLERFRGESGDDATIDPVIAEADQLVAADTYHDTRAALRKLSETRGQYYLNRRLLARSAMHEALFQVRFGEDPRSQNRERTILDRLALRGNDAPGIHAALAASRLRSGDPTVGIALAEAQSEAADDPYVHLIVGELALRNEEYDQAVTAFQAGSASGARWLWGIARAHRAAGHREEYAAAVAATLEASPQHAGALVAQGGLAFALGDIARAQEAAEQAAGETEVGGALLRASSVERAEAYGLLGRVHEHRGQRGHARRSYEAAVRASPFDIESLLGLGRVLLEERRYVDALTRFDSAEQAIGNEVAPAGALPYDVQVGIGKAEAAIALDQVQQAHATMMTLAEVHVELPVVVLWLGKALEGLEQYDEAISQYERAVALAPDQFDGYLAVAQLYFARDDPGRAGAILERARREVAPTSEVRRLLGQSELRRNRLSQAVAEFQAALELDDQNADAVYGLAIAHRRAQRLDQASTTLERLAVLDSAYPGLALERGRVFDAQGRPERAVRMYERALEAAPDDLSLVLRLGAAQVAAQHFDSAETTLRRVLQAEENNPEAEHFMGRVAFGREQYETAMVHLDRAVALDPSIGDYHMWLGWTYLRQNNLARAMESVTRAIEIDENLGGAYYVRGQVSLRGGAVRDAADDFEHALQLQPSLTVAYAGLAEAYDQNGSRSDAIAAYSRAVRGEPTNGRWQYRLGVLQMQAGRRGEALVSVTRATAIGDELEDAPGWLAEAHRVRGDAHRLGGERNAAGVHYRRYLALAPRGAIDREEVERLLRRLN